VILVSNDPKFGRAREKNPKSGKFSLRAELRAENRFLGPIGGTLLFSKIFFEISTGEWVIGVGDAEYRKIFEIREAVRECGIWKAERKNIFSSISSYK
jgi:hypothetical protein